MPDVNKRAVIWVWLSVLVVCLDQLSKWLVVQHLASGELYHFLPFLNFTLRYNSGAAFSFLHNAGGWHIYMLVVVPFVVIAFLLIWLWKTARADWMMGLALSLIMGGALGNVIDRIRFGYVVDFVDFHLGGWHFATFNVADSAISVGAFFLIVRLLFCR